MKYIIFSLSLLLLVGLFGWFGFSIYLAHTTGSTVSLEELALIGDSFGGHTSLFSALAFIGLLVTLQMQRQELALQRKELSLLREEFATSATAQQEMVQSMEEASKIMACSVLVQVLKDLNPDDCSDIDVDSRQIKYGDKFKWYLDKLELKVGIFNS